MRSLYVFLFLLIGLNLFSQKKEKSSGTTYVKPSIDRNGKFRKGHYRKSVSTDKNAVKNRARSKYYYHTKGKYRKK